MSEPKGIYTCALVEGHDDELRAENASLRTRLGEVEGALNKLRNEAKAVLSLGRPSLVQDVGLTNVQCLELRVKEADALLSPEAPSPASAAPAPMYVCNKCGYVGKTQTHEACNYLAAYAPPLAPPAPKSTGAVAYVCPWCKREFAPTLDAEPEDYEHCPLCYGSYSFAKPTRTPGECGVCGHPVDVSGRCTEGEADRG